ncbi:vanin-like protein 1 [Episyrphus balteatus]|uniref:vanin-like protein 1 n=1 Tax=Episyrphus balteatus TaxID=286459 RepID=UPI00248603CC|nr:vanin-like protein 1 [Episyrphus balteatus]
MNNMQYLTYIPEPKEKQIPCQNNKFESFLRDLSCAAKYSRKYIVVNLLEKETCSPASQADKNDPRPCAPNFLNYFNTNVVFDRNGAIIARYRKFNSYDLALNVTYRPELSTFDTDFGVKFGMFICFDMNFYSPAKELVDSGVTDFIFSSFWFSELPFLTAVQLQQSWAYANNVNLLAAGASNPSGGTTGSGIFSGKQGALVSVMAETPERKLYIANVTKSSEFKTSERLTNEPNSNQIRKKSTGGIRLMREYRMEAFTSELLEPNSNSIIQKQICHDAFCCQFNLKLQQKSPLPGTSTYKYHLAVFDGDRNYSGFGYTKYKFCSIYACTDTNLDSCGKVFDNKVEVSPEIVFESISIKGDFPKADKALIMPNSLDQNLMPLTTDRFEFNIKDDKQNEQVKFTLVDNADDLLTFGIYANYYN